MDILVVYKVGMVILGTFMSIDLARITWLALRHRRVSLPPAGLVNWFVTRRVGPEVVNQRLQRIQPWVRLYGYMSLISTVLMVYLVVDEILEVFQLLAGQ